MTSGFYFFDQISHASRIGGVPRYRRDSKDLNHALYHIKAESSIEDNDLNKTETIQKILRKTKTPIIPETLTKELDTMLQTFIDKSNSSQPNEQETDNDDELINSITNLSKISLPSSLILRLHSTWSDLIKTTDYKHKIWRTKSGEELWRQHVQQKRTEQLNSEKQQHNIHNKPTIHDPTNSCINVTSKNPKIRLNRSLSRASFLNTNNISQDNQRLLKLIHQGTSENVSEPIKNGIHVQFKLSTQIDETKQKTQINEQKIVLFDVPKTEVNLNEDIIVSTQNKCKRLLAETKQKILATTNNQNIKHPKICRVWFYGDNQYIRNKNTLLTLNELNRRQKSKFVLAILRHEIPEKYNIDIDIPETKQKCYVELIDGSSQIYYPSGHLAVLRLPSPFSTTLFFDDTDLTANQFLGLVTSTGNVLLMQPTFHARFITDNQQEHAYLCNGKIGIIEKQLQWNLTNNSQRQSISIDEDDINPPLLENTVQFQINSFMQLEYHNPSNIRFAFTCQNEEFKFQLGVHLSPPSQSPSSIDLTTTKRSNSISSNDASNLLEKQQTESQILPEEQVNFLQLPMMKELILLRKRIRHICDSWLKEYRTTLGIMDIDAYCLSDLPPSTPQPTIIQTKQQIDSMNRCKSAKQPRLVPISIKRTSSKNDFVKSTDNQQLLKISSTERSESNVIANAIEQFVPHSDAGHTIKQQIYTKKPIITTTSPVSK